MSAVGGYPSVDACWFDAIEFLLDKLRQTKNNADFFEQMNT